jgi:hypothetical protein
MIRIYLVTIQLFGILLVKLFFSGDASVKIDAPAQINAGNEIKVQITINKNEIQGFSRFQMDLPVGLTATNVVSANADFSFKDQKVRFIWLRLPDDPVVTIAFTIRCYEQLKGTFDLAGKFSYIENNERKNVDLISQNVAIVPSPSIDPSLLVDIKDFGKMAMPQIGSSAGQVACIRQVPVWSDLNKEYMVTLLVNKEKLKKFAKIEEIIPPGFTALNVDSKDGIFTAKDTKLKFLWMNLPADPYFTISYKLIPAKTAVQKAPMMAGTFSYMEEDKTLSVAIVQKDVSLANLTPESVRNILQGTSQLASATTNHQTEPGLESNTESQTTVNTAKQNITKQTAKTVPDKQIASEIKTDMKRPLHLEAATGNESSDLLDPQTGIYYRVQIAAGHSPVNVKRYFKRFKLDNTVYKEEHNGWIKYSVGSFPMYKDAHDYRVHIWNTTSIADAFVSAYNSGKRITVQEALMVANQRWYK